MLNAIKSLIKEKTAFQEDAQIILEDTMPANALDDQLIISESMNDFDYDALMKAGREDEIDTAIEAGNEEPEMDDNDTETHTPDNNDSDNDDIMDSEIDGDEPVRNPEPIDTMADDDIMNTEIDNEPNPDPNSLPEPVGAQTGEPVNDNNDILSMEIDMGSNTPKDILPIPPASAVDAVNNSDEDNIMNQRIDSGFGGDTQPVEEPAENLEEKPAESKAPAEAASEETETPVEDVELESARTEAFRAFLEEISLGGDEPDSEEKPTDGESSTETAEASAEPTGDNTASAESEPAPAEEEESPVTAAVKDKVAESDAADSVTTVAPAQNNQEIMNKLSNITKNLEDVKKSIMSNALNESTPLYIEDEKKYLDRRCKEELAGTDRYYDALISQYEREFKDFMKRNDADPNDKRYSKILTDYITKTNNERKESHQRIINKYNELKKKIE